VRLYDDKIFKFPCASHRMNAVLKDLFVPETIVIKPANNLKGADEYFLKKYDPESYTTEQIKLTRDQLKQITTRNEV
jgi:hypothetical protein